MSSWGERERMIFRINGETIIYSLEMTLRLMKSSNLLMAQGLFDYAVERLTYGPDPDIRVRPQTEVGLRDE